MKDIQEHLLEYVTGLREHGISRDTVHHLTVAPRKNSTRAERYKGYVNARVPSKRNNYREKSANQHYLFVKVAYREELVTKFDEECQFYSSDDMNKLKVNPATTISRNHQMLRIFMADDSPNTGDHDFPNANYLLVPSGYMTLIRKGNTDIASTYVAVDINDYSTTSKNTFEIDTEDEISEDVESTNGNDSCDDKIIKDKLGREHYERFKAGPSRVVLRSSKFDSTTSQSHMNDILPLLAAQVKDGKGVAFVKVDNGSDWNISYLVNQLYFFRVWRELGLDILGFISYAAKYSAYNNIEHLWSPLSKALSGVILPSVLEGENEIPCKQSLAPSVLEEKEKSVFDQAMQLVVSEYWKDLSFNNSEVRTDFKSCFLKESPYDDYKEVHTLLTGPYSKLRDSAKLMEELKMLFKHIDRKSNEVIFCKCTNPRCPHCTENFDHFYKGMGFSQGKRIQVDEPKIIGGAPRTLSNFY